MMRNDDIAGMRFDVSAGPASSGERRSSSGSGVRASWLRVGEPAPWFECRTSSRDRYVFDTVAGRHVVLCFFGSMADVGAQALDAILAARARFDDVDVSFFGVSSDPDDAHDARLRDAIPGIRFFRDWDRAVSALYGALLPDGGFRPVTYVLDPALRVVDVIPLRDDSAAHAAAVFATLDRLPRIEPPQLARAQAPVLVLPRIFEPALCADLVAYYRASGGKESGFMREVDGMTKLIVDPEHKRRRDCPIEDERLRSACMVRIHDRLVPEIHKAFQFRATRIERYVVACYDANDAGHFRPHRDNTTKGTAHRRFAVSLFLNSGEYDGGFLRFPEFGSALYAAPTGGAVVFSCSLLHEATPVTRGSRFMFLPFLYDDAARRIRNENLRYIDGADPAPIEV
jgi:peroxiredoxin/predicted 2-oxoglutarate/Fe(II)-dependent dioxygenase YbiX